MALAQQWRDLQDGLPPDWSALQLRLTMSDPASASRAAALLGPAQPIRPHPDVFRFGSSRTGEAQGPEAVVRLLARLDGERIGGTLELVETDRAEALVPAAPVTLADSWRAEEAKLPADWSDVYAEVEFLSSDYLERAAVLCVPLNPRREPATLAMRFRAARVAGYGASPGMVLRCFERCDRAGLRGSVRVLRALSDSRLLDTQGPVWMLEGRNV